MTSINYLNSALRFLTDVPPKHLNIYPKSGDCAIQFVIDRLSEFRPAFRRRVRFTPIPFIMESNEGLWRLKGILPSEPIVESGTWITQCDDSLWTFFYKLDLQPGTTVKWKGEATIMVASNMSDWSGSMVSFESQRIDELPVPQYDRESGMDLPFIYANLLSLIMFTRYFDFETRTIPPGRSETHLETEYLNESAFPIEVVDSPWFTQLMKNPKFIEGNPKDGFFRMQRYGPASSRQKLVWVSARNSTPYRKTPHSPSGTPQP